MELLLELSASALTSSPWWSMSSLDRSSFHLAHGLHRDLLGHEKLVEPTVLVILNGEGVDSVASCVHLRVKGLAGSARPA